LISLHGDSAEAQKCFAVSTSRINGDFVYFIFHHLRLQTVVSVVRVDVMWCRTTWTGVA